MPIGMPGWPELAFCTASMASARIALHMSRSSAAEARDAVIAGGRSSEKDPFYQAGLALDSDSTPVQRATCNSSRAFRGRPNTSLSFNTDLLYDPGRSFGSDQHWKQRDARRFFLFQAGTSPPPEPIDAVPSALHRPGAAHQRAGPEPMGCGVTTVIQVDWADLQGGRRCKA